MSKLIKLLILITFLTPFMLLASFNRAGVPYQVGAIHDKTDIRITTLNNAKTNYSGSYNGNVSLMYTKWNGSAVQWVGINRSVHLIQPNYTLNNYVYDLNYIDIYTVGLVNGTGSQNIADNLTAEINVTDSFSFAQEFISPDEIYLNELAIYLNFSLTASELYKYEVYIYDETMQDIIDYNETWDNRQVVAEWFTFMFPNNILEAGKKYNIVLSVWFDSESDYRATNFWKAATHNGTNDQGTSRIYNGTHWNQIENDNTTDFLCVFQYQKLINPSSVDLKYIIEGNVYIPTHRRGFYYTGYGYESFYSYNLATAPNHYINLTVTTNQTIASMYVIMYPRYSYLVNIAGVYNTTGNIVEWEIKYPYRDISGSVTMDYFMFERDWTLVHFYHPNGEEFEDLFFGNIKLWNETYMGITDVAGISLEQDTFTGIFNAPNYFGGISTKLKLNNGTFQNVHSYQIGQTMRLEFQITDSNDLPINGGSGQIELISPKGTVIYNGTGLSSINGTINSYEIILGSDIEEGIYVINVFWTNGRKIAHSSTIVEIMKPKDIIPFIPFSNELSTEMLILIGFLIVAAAATPAALIIRRQIQRRNWEKSCRNLFILAKNGVSMYGYSFGIEIPDPNLISAMISALTSFIQEAIGSKKLLRTIDQEDKKVLLYHGKYSISALIADKEVSIMHDKLLAFHNDFELHYSSKIKNWNGDTTIFKGVDKIIEKYFPVDMEEKIIRGVRHKIVEFTERALTITKPADIVSLFREIAEFSSRYQIIINKHYLKQYNELLRIIEEKL
ncbi:MAG: hypothetical protein ACTSO9_05015 [Candidatus Helarchaeota archaeon]